MGLLWPPFMLEDHIPPPTHRLLQLRPQIQGQFTKTWAAGPGWPRPREER